MQSNFHAMTSAMLRAVEAADPDADHGPLPFAAEQLRGTIEQSSRTRGEPFRASGHEAFDAAMQAMGPIWHYGPFEPGHTIIGFPDPGQAPEFIAMPDPAHFTSAAGYRRVAAHELVHWTQTADRMNRPNSGWSPLERMLGIIPDGYAREEAIAELGAELLLDALGAGTDVPDSALYVRGWLTGEADPMAVARDAADHAEAAVRWLLARMTAG